MPLQIKITFDSQAFSDQVYCGISRYFCDPASLLPAVNSNVWIKIITLMYVNVYIRLVPESWRHYKLEHGRRILLEKDIAIYRKKYCKNYVSDGNSFHLFLKKKINKNLWPIMKKLGILMLFTSCFFLNSKTWSDHQLMVGK